MLLVPARDPFSISSVAFTRDHVQKHGYLPPLLLLDLFGVLNGRLGGELGIVGDDPCGRGRRGKRGYMHVQGYSGGRVGWKLFGGRYREGDWHSRDSGFIGCNDLRRLTYSGCDKRGPSVLLYSKKQKSHVGRIVFAP